jgi:hypothetical protein
MDITALGKEGSWVAHSPVWQDQRWFFVNGLNRHTFKVPQAMVLIQNKQIFPVHRNEQFGVPTLVSSNPAKQNG